ncbi:phage tail tape measure protein [Rahnella sp. ChDrAdgB13]|uniref:phage tail tape measure protein n=1 Tax=Rahnella sp. ChDrAdgB13 TaxID=1850581 RepID=UPI001AD87C03|nr:phage tail tape measure protein [Rahnella sp. ChDrAdgB13]
MAGPFETQVGIGLKDDFTAKYRKIQQDVKQAQQARERLGIQSEQSIRNEIRQTSAAYEQLGRSGIASASEMARAYDKTTDKISKLRRELGETERTQSRMVSAMERLKSLGGIVAGVTAAGMVLKQPISQQMNYDSELHKTANFLYRDSNDVKTRLAGVGTIRDKVDAARQYGGGTREEGLQALEVMGRSKMERDDAFSSLPEVMKIHTATGADAADVASLMTSTFNFGLTGKQGNAALDAATTAAQHGKADVSLLAREAPRGLENARGAGFVGPKGFSDVLALYEVASSIAGSPEEGATNTNDLINELSSVNLANSSSRVKINGKRLDFKSMALKDAQHGHNTLYTLEHMVRAVDDHDKEMAGLRNKLKSTSDPKAQGNIQRAIDERHRQNVGLFLHNQQSSAAFLGYERNPEQFESMSKEIESQFSKPEGQRSTDVDYAVMADTSDYKVQKADEEKKRASDAAVKPLADALGDLALKTADLAVEFPKVATAAEGAAIALSAVAAFGALKGGGSLLDTLRGKPGAGINEAENAAEDLTKKPGWLVRGGKWLGGAVVTAGKNAVKLGGAAVRGGGKVLGWGLDNPSWMINPVTAGIAGMWPGETVSGSDEASELERQKQINLKKNRQRTSGDALNMLQNWPGRDASAGGHTPVFQLPTQPAPIVNVQVHLDGQEITGFVHTSTTRNARRHGA